MIRWLDKRVIYKVTQNYLILSSLQYGTLVILPSKAPPLLSIQWEAQTRGIEGTLA